MRLLGRILLIGLAYCAAALSAGLFLAVTAAAFVIRGEDSLPVPEAAFLTVFVGVVAGLVVAAIAAVPASVAIVLAEVRRWRSLLYYLVAGGIIAPVSIYLAAAGRAAGADGRLMPGDVLSVYVLGAGFVAGFVYWLVAGRAAGLWRDAEDRSTRRAVDRTLERMRAGDRR